MKRTLTIHAHNIMLFLVGGVVVSVAAAIYNPPEVLRFCGGLFYGWKTYHLFPWSSVREK